MKELKSVLGGGSTRRKEPLLIQDNTRRESTIREFPSVDSIRIDFTAALKAADLIFGFERIFILSYIYSFFYIYKKKTR